jgi:hypothetical protein
MVEEQADGAYPRLNAALVQSGRFESQIVSLVGKFQPHNGMSGMSHNARSFTACDNGTLTLTTEHVDPTVLHQLDNTEMVYEIVGQIAAGNAVTVRSRPIDSPRSMFVFSPPARYTLLIPLRYLNIPL